MTRTKTTRYQLLSNDLLDKLEGMSRDDQGEWLFLAPSEEFQGRWKVEGLWPDFFFDFEEIVGHYQTVSPANLSEFLDVADELGYHVVFEEPPEQILEAYDGLREPPPFSIHSDLEGASINGLFPWQVEGFNKLVRDESLSSGLAVWDTGTGKTALIASALMWHSYHGHPYDLALVVAKKNNKIDMQTKIKALAGLDSFVIQGPVKKRDSVYEEIVVALESGEKAIVVCNYETFREDHELFTFMVDGRNVLFFWDEMPTRLSNRQTKVYKAVKEIVWDKYDNSNLENAEPRAKWMRQWELSATPIENSPEGLFNTVRILYPALLGTIGQFETNYVSWRNPISKKPERWNRLDKMEGKIEFMTHRVSREDPEVAAMFPEVMEDPLLIDWDHRDRAVYDALSGKAVEIVEEADDFAEANVLALIQVLQMVCDAPSMIGRSADNRKEFEALIRDLGEDDQLPRVATGSELAVRLVEKLKRVPTDDHHTKFETLHEVLTEKHPDAKVLLYMTWADYGYAPMEAKLDKWGISYVSYRGTDKHRQAVKDEFRINDDIRVFLSSDKGSDSIDLPEAAVGINYNLPWTWTRKRQRMGRNDRVDSRLDTTWWYDLIMANSVELRKDEIIRTKKGYHKALFDGAAAQDSASSKLTREDILYILRGS